MEKVERLSVNKHKIFLILLKYTPAILAIGYCLASILQCFDIDTYIITYSVFTGIVPVIFLFVASLVFKFCEYHRIYLYYIVINEILNIIDYNTAFIDNSSMYIRIHVILFFLATILTTVMYIYAKQNSNTTKSVAEND